MTVVLGQDGAVVRGRCEGGARVVRGWYVPAVRGWYGAVRGRCEGGTGRYEGGTYRRRPRARTIPAWLLRSHHLLLL